MKRNVAVRLRPEDVASVETLRAHLPRELRQDWRRATFSDALRWLVIWGLHVVETWSTHEKVLRIRAQGGQGGMRAPRGTNRLVTLRLREVEFRSVDDLCKGLLSESHDVTLSDLLRLLVREGSKVKALALAARTVAAP